MPDLFHRIRWTNVARAAALLLAVLLALAWPRLKGHDEPLPPAGAEPVTVAEGGEAEEAAPSEDDAAVGATAPGEAEPHATPGDRVRATRRKTAARRKAKAAAAKRAKRRRETVARRRRAGGTPTPAAASPGAAGPAIAPPPPAPPGAEFRP